MQTFIERVRSIAGDSGIDAGKAQGLSPADLADERMRAGGPGTIGALSAVVDGLQAQMSDPLKMRLAVGAGAGSGGQSIAGGRVGGAFSAAPSIDRSTHHRWSERLRRRAAELRAGVGDGAAREGPVMRSALQELERDAETPSDQRKVSEFTSLVDKAEAISERDARFQRESASLMAEHQGALRVLRRSPHNARARSAVVQLDARLRSHAKAWRKNHRARRVLARRAARLLAGP